jgi:hypothetical protein
MKLKTIIALTVVGLVIIFGCIVFGMSVSYNYQEIALRKKADAQKGNIEVVHDQMWKIISQQAQVTENYKDAFDSIYTNIISGRYSKGDGSLMKFIKEANPNFDTKLYDKLMNSIEDQREQFTMEQKKMLDIINQHETLCNSYFYGWFISNKTPIQYTVISSTKTKQVMLTGKDDDVDLKLN